MKRALIIVCWLAVLLAGGWLRFDDLSKRPMHADEATGARIASRRMESGGASFDPRHYHGPLLADLAIPLCRARGETRWQEMSKLSLRLVTAGAGCLVVLLPLFGRRRYGELPMLLAAAFLASSPLLVYYSRMFIHEMLLTLCGVALLFVGPRAARLGLPGFLLGLMFAAKETFAISVLAWTGAAALLAVEHRRLIDRPLLRRWLWPAGLSIAAFLLTAGFCYTDAFRHPAGAIDAVRTYFVYETVDGHDKPGHWYFQLLALPQHSAGVWWYGTPVLVLALWAWMASFSSASDSRTRPYVRFLGWAAAGHFLIYSLFAYKTPWLACLPWAHLCLLAGFAAAVPNAVTRVFLTSIAGIAVTTQLLQARLATGRLESDARNPFAYVPTRPDIERLAVWLAELRASLPAGTMDRAGVIGRDYWPLPWYLRGIPNTGYWSEMPPDLVKLPLVFALPESADAVTAALADSHVALPRGLREGVPVIVLVRNEMWKSWMNAEDP